MNKKRFSFYYSNTLLLCWYLLCYHFFLPLRFICVVFFAGGVLLPERLYEPGASAGDLLPVTGMAPPIPPSCIAAPPEAGE